MGHDLPTTAIMEIGGLVADKLRARYGDEEDIGKRGRATNAQVNHTHYSLISVE